MKIVGIDPGLEGFAFFTDSDKKVFSGHKFYFTKDKIFDSDSFKFYLAECNPDLILIENVHGRGGWGAVHNFNFGFVFGQIISCFAHTVKFEKVMPTSWQSVFHSQVLKIPKEKIKDRTKRAYDLFFRKDPLNKNYSTPRKKETDNNAIDAFLISLYGQITYAEEKSIIDYKESRC